MKYKLLHPIKIDKTEDAPEQELRELNLVDRILTEHAQHIPDECYEGNANPIKYLPLIVSMSNINTATANKMDFRDLVKIVREIVAPFLLSSATEEKK